MLITILLMVRITRTGTTHSPPPVGIGDDGCGLVGLGAVVVGLGAVGGLLTTG